MQVKKKIPRTLVFNYRGDIRDIAYLVLYFEGKGIEISSKAEVARVAISTLVTLLKTRNKDEEEIPTNDALRLLRSRGLMDYNKEGKRSRMKQMILEGDIVSDASILDEMGLDITKEVDSKIVEELAQVKRKEE